jgi:hypothetical protein
MSNGGFMGRADPHPSTNEHVKKTHHRQEAELGFADIEQELKTYATGAHSFGELRHHRWTLPFLPAINMLP